MAVRVTQQVFASLHTAFGYEPTRAGQITLAVAAANNAIGPLKVSVIVLQCLCLNGPGPLSRPGAEYPPGVEIVMPAIYPTLPGLSYSVIKRPKWYTGVGTSASGREVRVAYAAFPLWEWDLTYTYLPDEQTPSSLTPSDIKQLVGFYLSQSGSFGSFLFQDPDDNAVTQQLIAIGDGTTTNFTLFRSYGGSNGAGNEPIGYVDQSQPFAAYVAGALADPSTYTVAVINPVAQVLKFNAAPAAGAAITVTMSYFYSVRFKDDHIDFEKFMDKLWQTATITLMSQRA